LFYFGCKLFCRQLEGPVESGSTSLVRSFESIESGLPGWKLIEFMLLFNPSASIFSSKAAAAQHPVSDIRRTHGD
jgi:hypothetical protein